MTTTDLALLEASIDHVVEIETLDGIRFLATPLFVYTGEDNPDLFFLPVNRNKAGEPVPGAEGQTMLLEDIRAVRTPPGDLRVPVPSLNPER